VTIPPGKTLYEYHVRNFPAKASRNKRRVMILDMIEIDSDLFNVRDTIATDYREKIISCTPLFTVTSAPLGQSVHTVRVNNFEPGSRSDQPAVVELEILYVAKHELDGLRNFVEGRNEAYKDTGAKEAMNIIIAKSASYPTSNRNTFQVGDNRFFYRPGWSDISDARGTDSIGLVSTRDRSQAVGQDPGSNAPARRNKLLCDLGDISEREKFYTSTGKGWTVWDYLKEEYGNVKTDEGKAAVEISDKVLPAANVGQKKHNKKFYLPRQLDVLADQLYRGQLSGWATSKMIEVAKKRPEENYHAILQEGLRCLRLLPGMPPSQLMSDLGMTIEAKLVQLHAHVYEHPRIVYSEKPVKPNLGYWVIPKEVKFFDVKSGSGKGVIRVFYPELPHKDGKFTRPPLSDYVELLRDIHSGLGGKSLPMMALSWRFKTGRSKTLNR
jgi:hypothetical protein